MNFDSPTPRRAVRLRARFREATEREILRAAETTLATHGLDGLNMCDVAAQAGVAVGTIYNYFRDRDDLVGALFRERRAAFAKALADDARACGGRPFAEQMSSFVGMAFAEFGAHRDFFRSAFESEAWRRRALAERGRKSRRVMQQMADRIKELARQGLEEGALRPDLAPHLEAIFFGIVHTLFAYQLRERETMPAPRLAELVLDVLLTGCGARP